MPRIVLLVALLLHAAAQAQHRVLEMLVYPNAGVFEAAPGKGPGGPGGAMLQRLQQLSGVTLNQQFMPVPRALLTARQTPGHCAIGVTRTPDRESQLMWASPWARAASTGYARADDPRAVQHPQELRGSSIVVMRDSALAEWLRAQALAATEVKDNVLGLRMLQARRVDDWLANSLAAHFIIRAEGGPSPRGGAQLRAARPLHRLPPGH